MTLIVGKTVSGMGGKTTWGEMSMKQSGLLF